MAFHFGFEFRGRLYWYKPSFDPGVARLSPGKVLLSYLISDALERGLKELDFTVGAEPFKARYTDTHRINSILRIFNRRWHYLAFVSAIRANGALVRLGLWARHGQKLVAHPTPSAPGTAHLRGVEPASHPHASKRS